MARRIRSSLEHRSKRLALAPRKKPYTVRIAAGIRLGYRRTTTGGTWSVLRSDGMGSNWLKKFAASDDHEDANGKTILDYWQASETARKLARGDDAGEVEAGRPLSIGEAISNYERDLIGRDGDPGNARRLRFHVPSSIATKPVAMVSPREVRAFRDLLVAKGLTRATVNRTMKVFAAAMTLAANDDERISNRRAWRIPALSDATTARNVILTDEQVRAVVAASFQTGGDRFGTYIQTLAETGTRPSQARRLVVSDLESHPEGPRLQMPSSRKGKGKKRIERTPLPISDGLAARLKVEAAGRAYDEPLLLDVDGTSWTGAGHPKRFAVAAAAAKLPKNATAYSLRHSFVVRALLKGIPLRLVAASVDSSASMIEAHYSRYIAHPGADMMRGALLDVNAANAVNVVKLRKA